MILFLGMYERTCQYSTGGVPNTASMIDKTHIDMDTPPWKGASVVYCAESID
jgi:hypothetical protein